MTVNSSSKQIPGTEKAIGYGSVIGRTPPWPTVTLVLPALAGAVPGMFFWKLSFQQSRSSEPHGATTAA